MPDSNIALKWLEFLPVSWLELIYRRARELCDRPPVGLSLHGDDDTIRLCKVLCDMYDVDITCSKELDASDVPHLWANGYRLDSIGSIFYIASVTRMLPRDPEILAVMLGAYEHLLQARKTADVVSVAVDYMGSRYMCDMNSISFLDVAVALRLRPEIDDLEESMRAYVREVLETVDEETNVHISAQSQEALRAKGNDCSGSQPQRYESQTLSQKARCSHDDTSGRVSE